MDIYNVDNQPDAPQGDNAPQPTTQGTSVPPSAPAAQPQLASMSPPPLPPRATKTSRMWLWVVAGGGAFFLFVLAIFTLVYISLRTDRQSGLGGFGDKIGVVDLDGVILEPETTVKELK